MALVHYPVRPEVSVAPFIDCIYAMLTRGSLTDWFFFVVLDLGNPAIRDISIGTRCIIGLLQATAVRSAGFATVTLSALAPAVK